MKHALLLLVVLVLTIPLAMAERQEAIARFVVGNYLLIGKSVDSTETYHGTIEIHADGKQLGVKRVINGETVLGSGAIEQALGGDTDVLRIRFTQYGKVFEETCLVSGDLDNYARISCYLYQPGVKTMNPGLEAFFHDKNP
ncbi:MAG: hypothetical protein ABW162_06275 [Candidatus Sedimenticola sp. PURPLELP]